jgi:hypothetical protein
MQEQLLTFYGLADCHGIESFIATEVFDPETEELFTPKDQTGMIAMRAQFNAQRWPVVYKVSLELEDAHDIEELLQDGEYEEALNTLKERAHNISLARVPGTNPKKNWDMIPNPNLDPHS